MSISKPVLHHVWANSAATGDIVEPANSLKDSGWTGTPAPPYQYFNWVQNEDGKWIEYIRARGIPDWGSDESYTIGDIALMSIDSGASYQSFQCIVACTAQAPMIWSTDHYVLNDTYWQHFGFSDADFATRSGSLNGSYGFSTTSGSISNGNQLGIPGTTEKIVSFIATIPMSAGYGTTDVTLSLVTAFVTGILVAVATPAGYDAGHTTDAHAYAKKISANVVRVEITASGAATTYDVNVMLMGN